MWNTRILGIDLYHVLAFFWLYSFFGWIWECTYVSIKERKLVNRGFVNGPLLTIYGCGAVSVYLILRPLENSILFLYLGGVVVATVLELVTGLLMEKLFHASWWDYSNKKFNFRGKICLESSVCWGFFTLLLFFVLQPVVESIVELFERRVGEWILVAVTACYSVDFCFSAVAAFQLGEKLRQMEQVWDEFAEYLANSRMTQAAEAMKEKAALYREEYSAERIRQYLEERRRTLEEFLNQEIFSEVLEQAKKKLGEYASDGESFAYMERMLSYAAEKKEQLGDFGENQMERFANFSEEQRERFEAFLSERRKDLDLHSEEMKKDVLEHFDYFAGAYIRGKKKLDFISRRYMRAYPHLKVTKRRSDREKKEKKS